MIRNRITVGLLAALLVVSAVGAGGLVPSVLAADDSDDNDSRANATVIDVGSTTNKTIVQGDTDWYAVDIESGKSILAELTITTENEEDLRFELFNPDGERIGESPYDMMVPGYVTDRVAWGDSAIGGDVTEQSGTYYVRVQSVEENLSEPTNYELTVEAEELDQHDPNEEPATATQIEANDTISGALTGTDRDTYAIDLEKGETITVTTEYVANEFTPYTYLVGPNASNVTLDPYIDREYALASEPIGWENEFTYTANTSGTHFLRVNPYIETSTIKSFEYTSSYNVSVDVSGADVDDESDSDPPTEGESENTTEDSNESTNENKNGNESTDSSPDTDDSEQTEQSDETGSDESNTMDGTDADTTDDTSTDTESSERSECGEGHTSDRSNCEEVVTSSNQSDC